MIIYTDSDAMVFGDGGGCSEITPAHHYLLTTDFSIILDELANGNIPCGTGKPFPVNWKNDSADDNLAPPWIERTNYQRPPVNGFVNPFNGL